MSTTSSTTFPFGAPGIAGGDPCTCGSPRRDHYRFLGKDGLADHEFELEVFSEKARFTAWLVEELALSLEYARNLNEPSVARIRAEGRINGLHQVANQLGIHELSEPYKLRYPGGKDGFYVVNCTCGYQSAPSGYPQRAVKPAQAHKEAKEAS